jgi:O-antigen ligase
VIIKYRNKLIEIGGHMVAVLLPLYFNPYAHQSHEANKVRLFEWITMGMLFVALAALVLELLDAKNFREARFIARDKIKTLREGNPLLLPCLFYATVYILATLVSIDPMKSWWGVTTLQGTVTILCTILFFILLTSAIQEKKQINRLISSVILGSIPVALYGWVQFLGFDPLEWTSGSISQVQATLVYSLFLGSYLAIVIPFTLSRIISGWRGAPYSVWGYGFIAVLQTTCLVFTLARGAWLGVTIGSILLVGILAYRWRMRLLVYSSVVVTILGIMVFVLLNIGWAFPASHRYEWLSPERVMEFRRISNNERLALWRYTLPVISQRLWLGYGPETFSSAFQSNSSIEAASNLNVYPPWDPHNWFLYHLTAVGLLGFLAFIWLLFIFFRNVTAAMFQIEIMELQVACAAVISAVAVYLIQAQFNPTGITPLAIFWIVFALGAALGSDRFSHQFENFPMSGSF